MPITYRCGHEEPAEAPEARFCVRCGRPVAQMCPNCENVLPLVGPNGKPPTVCDKCGCLLKVCGRCGRLYPLQEMVCINDDCGQPLVEPADAFPSAFGPLDGTRAVNWRGGFGTAIKPIQVQDVADAQQLAFRYGLLMVVSERDFLTYTWDGGQWKPKAQQALVNAGSLNVRSLIVDDGYAFIIASDQAFVVRLSPLAVQNDNLPGNHRLQAKYGPWWVRVADNGGSAKLQLTDCRTWQSREIALSVPAEDINDVAIADDILVATRTSGVVPVGLDAGQLPAFPLPGGQWIRLAVRGQSVLAMGYDGDGDLCLVALQGAIRVSQAKLEASSITDFAWVGDNVMVPTSAGIATYSALTLTSNPKLIGLRQDRQSQAGMLGLRNENGDVRVLIRRVQGKLNELYMIDPATGNQVAVGGAMADTPLVCLAGELIVVAVRESGGFRIRTMKFQEDADGFRS